jgi:hypothetical protein
MRTWSVSAFLPDVRPAHQAQQSCIVEACDMPAAARRGLAEILALEAIKGKRVSVVKLTIVAADKGKDS